MAAFLAPARLPLSSTTDDDQNKRDERSIDIPHDYLRSLIVGHSKGPSPRTSLANTTVFCASLPEAIAIPGLYTRYTALGQPLDDSMRESATSDTRPNSPPELSYSKSSKSSSSLSLSSSDDETQSDGGLTEQSTQLTEVALEDASRDSVEDSNLPPDSRPTLQRPPQRSSTLADFRAKAPSPPLRDTPQSSRPKFPPLDGPVRSVLQDQSRNLPNGRTMLRSHSIPNSPFTAQRPQKTSSRSPSPNKPLVQSNLRSFAQTNSSATSVASSAISKLGGSLARRMSWQPERKSIAQLEAEYDDGDEDVPDEAILENVPISPMPGQYAYSRTSSISGLAGPRSNTPSPQRRPSYANLHSAKIPKNAKRPSAPLVFSTGQLGSPRSPSQNRTPVLTHSATFPYVPNEPLTRIQRSQSWTEDLNDEARQLSQALEAFGDRGSMENLPTGTVSASSSPPRPSLTKSRAKTSMAELPTVPAVQKGSIMIDPLPISKEKEAVLTRTRPSWLPPKSKREEKKHLREFQQMMARAADAEKKRVIKDQEDRESREEMQDNMARIWEQHVLPNWDTVVKEPRTRELWWRGVTPRNRGEVWQKAVGNELELSTTSFEAALARANALEEKIPELPAEERAHNKEAVWFDAIARDVPTVYPELDMFQQDAPLHKALGDVLKAYAMYRSDVGYVYGTHFVAGIVCMLLAPADAFVLLANLLNRPLTLGFLVHDQLAMGRAYELVLSTLKYKFTKLHDHLTSPALGLNPAEYLDPIFRCLFAYNLPHQHVCRIWDIFAFEGDTALIRAAVAVLGRLESRLYVSKDEVLDLVSWRNECRWEVGSEDDFIRAVREAGKVDDKGEVHSP